MQHAQIIASILCQHLSQDSPPTPFMPTMPFCERAKMPPGITAGDVFRVFANAVPAASLERAKGGGTLFQVKKGGLRQHLEEFQAMYSMLVDLAPNAILDKSVLETAMEAFH